MKKKKLIIFAIIVVLGVCTLIGIKLYKNTHQVTKSTFIPTYEELHDSGYKKDNEILKSDNFKDMMKDTNIKSKVAYVKTIKEKKSKKIQLVVGTEAAPLAYMSAQIDSENVDLSEISQPVNVKELANKLSGANFELELFAGDKVKINGHDRQNSYIKYDFKLKDFAKGKLDFKSIYDLECYQGSIDTSKDSKDLSKYKVSCPKNSSISTMKKQIAAIVLNG